MKNKSIYQYDIHLIKVEPSESDGNFNKNKYFSEYLKLVLIEEFIYIAQERVVEFIRKHYADYDVYSMDVDTLRYLDNDGIIKR